MKYLITSLILLLCFNLYSQEGISQKKIFLRVYNLEGKKIHKGKVLSISDSNLKLKKQNKIIQISYEEVGFIKTKRSTGHNTLIGASIGAASGIIISGTGESSNIPNSVGIGFLSTGGALLGLLSWSSKNYNKFEINGNQKNFKEFGNAIIGNN